MPRYCANCGIDHLAKHCPSKPVASGPPTRATLNLVDIGLEFKGSRATPFGVITRVWDQKQPTIEFELNKKPKRWEKKKVTKVNTPPQLQHKETLERARKEKQDELSKTSSGGSILMEKVNENLEALLKDFEGHIKLDTSLPNNLQEYPNPIQEKECLDENLRLIQETQTAVKMPPAMIE